MSTKKLDPRIERLLRLILEARRAGALEQAKGVRIKVVTAPAPEGGDREEDMHDTWAARCALTLRQACQDKGIGFLGYYGCMGAPSPPIEQFIHSQIVTGEKEWKRYVEEVRQHPDEDDLRQASSRSVCWPGAKPDPASRLISPFNLEKGV